MKTKLITVLFVISVLISACSSSPETNQTPSATAPASSTVGVTSIPTVDTIPSPAPTVTAVSSGFVDRQKLVTFFISNDYVCSDPDNKGNISCNIKAVNKGNGITGSKVSLIGDPVQTMLLMIEPLKDEDSLKVVRASLVDLAAQIDEKNPTPVQDWINKNFAIPVVNYSGKMANDDIPFQMSVDSNYVFFLVGRGRPSKAKPAETGEPTQSN